MPDSERCGGGTFEDGPGRAAGLLSLPAPELLAISPTAPEGRAKTLTPRFSPAPVGLANGPLGGRPGSRGDHPRRG